MYLSSCQAQKASFKRKHIVSESDSSKFDNCLMCGLPILLSKESLKSCCSICTVTWHHKCHGNGCPICEPNPSYLSLLHQRKISSLVLKAAIATLAVGNYSICFKSRSGELCYVGAGKRGAMDIGTWKIKEKGAKKVKTHYLFDSDIENDAVLFDPKENTDHIQLVNEDKSFINETNVKFGPTNGYTDRRIDLLCLHSLYPTFSFTILTKNRNPNDDILSVYVKRQYFEGSFTSSRLTYLEPFMPFNYTKQTAIDTSKQVIARILSCALPDVNLPKANQPLQIYIRLYEFQKRCLQWLIDREEKTVQYALPHHIDLEFFGKPYVYDCLDRCLHSDILHNMKYQYRAGGILADEMGLGKTLEILSLIASHPRTTFETMSNRIPIGATLIVVPSVILHQWLNEIAKTMPEAMIYQYPGMTKLEKTNIVLDQVKYEIQRADIILVPFEVCSKEVYFARPRSDRELRPSSIGPYSYAQSPLVLFEFWRVVIDEAQVVESRNSVVAKVAILLHCVNKWLVTGTPFGKHGLDDLYGFVQFLEIIPYEITRYWNLALKYSQSVLFIPELLKPVFYRNTKKNVADEINFPPQTEIVAWLDFTPVESFHYASINDEYHVEDLDTVLSLDAINSWFLRLRQSCCHPRIGHYHTRRDEPMTMSEVLQHLCSDVLSQWISEERRAFSIKLKLQIIKEIRDKNYEELVVENSRIFQDIKTCYDNFKEKKKIALDTMKEPSEDNSGNNDASISYASHMNRWAELMHQILFDLGCLTLELKQEETSNNWYNQAEQIRVELLKDCEEKFKEALGKIDGQVSKGENLRTLEWFRWDKSTLMNLQKSISSMEKVRGEQYYAERLNSNIVILEKLLASMFEQLKNVIDRRHTLLGRMHRELVTNYEEDAKFEEESQELQDKQNEALSQLERQIRTHENHNFSKTFHFFIRDERNAFIELSKLNPGYELEFRRLQIINEKYQEIINELNLENLLFIRAWNARIDFYCQLQKLSDQVAVPEYADINQEEAEALAEYDVVRKKADHNSRRFRYLENLMTNANSIQRNCPICRSDYVKGGIGPCGHLACYNCMKLWITTHRRCPFCKESLRPSDLKVIDENTSILKKEYRLPQVTSSFGTKIDYLVDQLHALISKDPSVQALVFSQWEQVLDVVQWALKKGHIESVRFNKNNPSIVDSFIMNANIKVLLLNAKNQSSGLTLVNATHVFLMEPSLNPAIELQAINRIYRIGQTHQTFIHRLLIRDTIEEKIYNGKYMQYKSVQRVQDEEDISKEILDIQDIRALIMNH